MEYSCYKDAFDAVVEDNDGVLPDLYEVFNFIIYCRPSYLKGPLTVAEIVACALIEASEAKVVNLPVAPSVGHLPFVTVAMGEPLYLDKLLDQAVTSLN
ncbi:MAG: hypothetical protein EOO60_00115 [Hymenobacter sp.]|nr:MAG: hypothetical protein EOO60_00115 [Hymenobacter sp.]